MKLRDMGFGDDDANLQALRQTGGDLNSAVNIIVKLPSTRASAPSSSAPAPAPVATARGEQAKLAQLYNFGFKDEKKNIDALRQASGNVDQAVNILVKQAVSNGSAFSSFFIFFFFFSFPFSSKIN
jgi:hypothetical protein